LLFLVLVIVIAKCEIRDSVLGVRRWTLGVRRFLHLLPCSLVPKLRLETLLSSKLCFLSAMSQLLRFPTSVERDPAIEVGMREHADELGAIAQRWFEIMRSCGDDVRELLQDGRPTACVGDAAFAYVNAFKAHVNVGFFRGTELVDRKGATRFRKARRTCARAG